jgi:hypothetical protein
MLKIIKNEALLSIVEKAQEIPYAQELRICFSNELNE